MNSEWLIELNKEDAKEVAEKIRSNDNWDIDDCADLCYLAGIEEEWIASYDTFESVVYKAAEILGVEI